MYNLVYKSIANTLTLAQVNEILAVSRDFNARYDITGCLIYHQGFFIQYLEGEAEVVLALFEKIRLDKRHRAVNLLSKGNIYSREFNTWSMAYLSNQLPNDAFRYIEQLVDPRIEPVGKSFLPNPTSKRFWLAAKALLHKIGHENFN